MVEFSDLTGLIRYLPYGPSLWDALREWPNEKIAQVNTITRFLNFSCGGDFMIYIETLLPATGGLVLVFLDVGWDDVAREFFRPMGIRSRFKFRKGKKKGGKKPKWMQKLHFAIPEPNELIAKMLPFAKVVKGRKVGNLQRWFWRIDGVAQRALYYWMIADVTSDFIYTWATGIMRHPRCYRSEYGWFRGGPGLWTVVPDGNLVWAGAPMPQSSGGRRPIEGIPVRVRPRESIDIMLSVKDASAFLEGDVTYEIGFGVQGTNELRSSPLWEAGFGKVGGVSVESFVNDTTEDYFVAPWIRAYSDKPNNLFLKDVIVAAVRRS